MSWLMNLFGKKEGEEEPGQQQRAPRPASSADVTGNTLAPPRQTTTPNPGAPDAARRRAAFQSESVKSAPPARQTPPSSTSPSPSSNTSPSPSSTPSSQSPSPSPSSSSSSSSSSSTRQPPSLLKTRQGPAAQISKSVSDIRRTTPSTRTATSTTRTTASRTSASASRVASKKKEAFKGNVIIDKTAVVCPNCVLQGDIRIGPGTVIHPYAQILAHGGPIVLGERNIVEEHCIISNSPSMLMDMETGGKGPTLYIGSHNLFEVGSHIMAKSIGDANVIEPKAQVNQGSVVGSGCVVGANVKIPKEMEVKDSLVVYGPLAASYEAEWARQEHMITHNAHIDILLNTLTKVYDKKLIKGTSEESS